MCMCTSILTRNMLVLSLCLFSFFPEVRTGRISRSYVLKIHNYNSLHMFNFDFINFKFLW